MTVLLNCHMAHRLGLTGDRLARMYLKGREKALARIGWEFYRLYSDDAP
jgi:hypothetical protein